MTCYRPGMRVHAVFRDGAQVEDELIENTRGDLCAALGSVVVHLLDRDKDGRLNPAPAVAAIRPVTTAPATRLGDGLCGMWSDRFGDLWACDGETARRVRRRGFWNACDAALAYDDLDRFAPFAPWHGDDL